MGVFKWWIKTVAAVGGSRQGVKPRCRAHTKKIMRFREQFHPHPPRFVCAYKALLPPPLKIAQIHIVLTV
jgi:hypothetical protein